METRNGWGIYFAGPDIFEVDARERLGRLQALATAHGLQGLVPVDEAGDDERAANAARICLANLALLRQADAVVANLRPFRGLEPDSGTVFEVGFAVAR
ncbi:nucleoside 2-deoxyribosyltransferase [Variovorax paradoxus]|uniref:nucleoside 2-deoxyribosyltransferase n=1 Tax=Variovorax paradoxus TaxID=34073 RepID=UPI00247936D0